MNLLKNTQAAGLAIDIVAATPGASAEDRVRQLIALRVRIDRTLDKLSGTVAAVRGDHAVVREVSQREGD